MEIPQSSPSARVGTPGLDVFKIAGQSISGFLQSLKTGDHHLVRMPFTTMLEARLALYLEYHPHVRSYQRGDMSPAFAKAYHIFTPLGTPYRILYLYDGHSHEYLPDFVGTLCDGSLLIAEAGRASEKRQGQPLAKAEAARRLAQLKGGVYWIGTDENLSARRYQNLLYLHARRLSFPTYDEIAATLLNHWPWGELRSANEFIHLFGPRWSEPEVEAAVWKLVGDAATAGRLLVDLSEVVLDHSTPLALLDPGTPPILPDPLPSSLEEAESNQEAHSPSEDEGEQSALELHAIIPGPTFDGSVLETAEQQAHFHRNLAAVTAVLTGGTLQQVAQEYLMSVSVLGRLVQRTKELGQIACVPYGTYHRDRALRPEFQQLIRTLYTHPMRPTMTAVYEDVRVTRLAEELSEREGKLVLPPTYRQVQYFLKGIAQDVKVAEARSGLKHPQRERMSPQSFVLSISSPALICQVDEHIFDQLVVTPDGIVITRRVHGAVLICVKTAAILGAVLALDSLKEEDYMRLVKQTLESKDRLVALYECQHRWPCSGKPAVIFHDRGKIFTSERATQVLVDRLGIMTEQAPPFAPSAKGTVEAVFTWMTRKFEHRLPGTTKATPRDRGAYDSVREAEKAGITLDVLEKLFMQAIVDGYMQEWDRLRRQTRIALWEDSVRTMGVPRWMGSQDDLKLLLMKAVNRKNPATGRYAISPQRGLSFLGRRYVSPGLLDRLRGKEIDIYYDRRDISVIYLFLEGELVGEALCTEFLGRRVSIWEAQAERQADAQQARAASAQSLESRQRIQHAATQGRRMLSLETKRLERQRQLDQQRQEIHPSHVQAVLQELIQHPPTSAPAKVTGLLPPAVPEDDPPGTEVVHLPVRSLEGQHD
jgi:transposase